MVLVPRLGGKGLLHHCNPAAIRSCVASREMGLECKGTGISVWQGLVQGSGTLTPCKGTSFRTKLFCKFPQIEGRP